MRMHGSQGNAGPSQVSLTPTGGGLGAARPWGRSQGNAGPSQVSWTPTGGGLGAARPWGRSQRAARLAAWTMGIALALASALVPARAQDLADLFKAVAIDAPHLVAQALKAGVDPNVRDGQGQLALVLALRDESLQAAEALLADPRLDVDAANAHGETALMMAAMRGQLAWLPRLQARGAQINRAGWTPLHYAASGSALGPVQWLLERGAALDARSPNGTTPLMMAARYGAIDAADWLLARGADRSLRNDRGLTAADFAAAAGRDDLAQRLRPR